MFDWVAKSVFELFTGSAQDKDRAQEQLRLVLERRLQPCLELWTDVWKFADDAQTRGRKEAESARADDIRRLSQRVDLFMHECGALISVPCLVALSRFQMALRDFDPNADELVRGAKASELHRQLFPSPEKDAKGKVVGQNPGLLMLLRDEIGSNARAASSTLK